MAEADLESLRAAILVLHAEKSRAYGTAWKKRGEVLGAVANIARKVDRLEHAAQHPEGTRDESLLDTSTDLLVYVIKYQTLLADADEGVRSAILPHLTGGRASDGTTGFEHLARTLRWPQPTPNVETAIRDVLSAFDRVEGLYAAANAIGPAMTRLKAAQNLAASAATLVATVAAARPAQTAAFIRTWKTGGLKA